MLAITRKIKQEAAKAAAPDQGAAASFYSIKTYFCRRDGLRTAAKQSRNIFFRRI